MKNISMCALVILALGLSACSHFGHGRSCGQGSCNMESKDKQECSKCCSGGECEMKK